jgi:hypothetical protein
MDDDLRDRALNIFLDATDDLPDDAEVGIEALIAAGLLGVVSPTDGWEQNFYADGTPHLFNGAPTFRREDGAAPQPEHRSIGKVGEPNYMGDCEACGEPWPCSAAPPDGEVERCPRCHYAGGCLDPKVWVGEVIDCGFCSWCRRAALSGSPNREERPCECPTQVVTYHDERCPFVDAPTVPEWGSGAL